MRARLLVTDLDNTLYDWVTFYAAAFTAMVRELATLLSVPEEELLDEFKAVHQRHGNSEHPFAALELPSVRRHFGQLPQTDLLQVLDRPFHAFNSIRKQRLRLYDGVASTLARLSGHGIAIVGHTEAIAANACFRLKMLGIERYFRHLYVLDGTYRGHPDPSRQQQLRPRANFVRTVPSAERKPNPDLLRDICRREGVAPEESVYVGDSLTRDISMARSAGVLAVWARYGTDYDRELWKVLVRITHWTDQDVEREAELRHRYGDVAPDLVIDSFAELSVFILDEAKRAAAGGA